MAHRAGSTRSRERRCLVSDSATVAKALLSEPWSPGQALARLVRAAEHLLHDHDCDTDGYEEVTMAVRAARAIPGGPLAIDALLGELVAVVEAREGRRDGDLRNELSAAEDLLLKQGKILSGVANALKGPPAPLLLHSHHDLAEVAHAMRASLAREAHDNAVAEAEDLRRMGVVLRAFGVVDWNDPLAALEELAAEVSRRKREATEEHSAAVLLARAEGRAAGLREAHDIAYRAMKRCLELAQEEPMGSAICEQRRARAAEANNIARDIEDRSTEVCHA